MMLAGVPSIKQQEPKSPILTSTCEFHKLYNNTTNIACYCFTHLATIDLVKEVAQLDITVQASLGVYF
jgi:hypothetical protein